MLSTLPRKAVYYVCEYAVYICKDTILWQVLQTKFLRTHPQIHGSKNDPMEYCSKDTASEHQGDMPKRKEGLKLRLKILNASKTRRLIDCWDKKRIARSSHALVWGQQRRRPNCLRHLCVRALTFALRPLRRWRASPCSCHHCSALLSRRRTY